MDKQLSPLQKAIKRCDERITMYKNDIKTSEYGGDTIRAAAFTHVVSGIKEIKKRLESLLPEERQFAEKAYHSGQTWLEVLDGGDFTEYYKQYEDE